MWSFDEQAKDLKKLLPQIEDITEHVVSADWYKMNVDMDHYGDKPVDIVQISYNADLYAMPRYMTHTHFCCTTPKELAEELEI